MVSLIDKLTVRSKYLDKPKINKFIHLIEGTQNIKIGDSANDTDRIYFELVAALSRDDKVSFERNYSDFSKRTPSQQSPWLYDNFMVFTLILGICKYDIDKYWINNVLLQRNNQNQSLQTINQTFRSLLSHNYQSTDNINEIVILFLDFLKYPQLTVKILDRTFQKVSSQTDLLQNRDDFLVVVSLRAHDIIVLTKDTPDAIEVAKLKSFKTVFTKRIGKVRDFIYYGLLVVLIYFALKYYREYDDLRDYISDIGAIFQILGFALLAFFKWIRKKIEEILLIIFGYSRFFEK